MMHSFLDSPPVSLITAHRISYQDGVTNKTLDETEMVSFLGYLLRNEMYDSYSQATWMSATASRGDDARALHISDLVNPTRLRSIGEMRFVYYDMQCANRFILHLLFYI